VATICADGSSLSPGLIYQGQTNSIQDTWLDGFDDKRTFCLLYIFPKWLDELGAWL